MALGLFDDLPDRRQERFAGEHHLFPALDEPPLPDDPLFIDQEEGPLGDLDLGQRGVEGQAPILPYCRVTRRSGKSLSSG